MLPVLMHGSEPSHVIKIFREFFVRKNFTVEKVEWPPSEQDRKSMNNSG